MDVWKTRTWKIYTRQWLGDDKVLTDITPCFLQRTPKQQSEQQVLGWKIIYERALCPDDDGDSFDDIDNEIYCIKNRRFR